MDTTSHLDLIVLGGGITALSIAYEARRRDLSVLVISAERAGEATRAAAGMLTPTCEADTGSPALIEMALASCRLYPQYIAQIESHANLSCDYQTNGTMLVALHQDHVSELEKLAMHQEAVGLETRWLEANQVRDMEPNTSPRQLGAMYAPSDHRVNPIKLHAALRRAFLKAGGKILPRRHGSIELKTEAGRVTAVALKDDTQGILTANHVVVAAGSWSNDLLPDTDQLALRPVKGQFLRLGQSPILERTIRTPDVYLVPRPDGELYIGATSEEVGFNAAPTAGAVLDLLQHAWRIVPGIYELDLLETGAGFRPATTDHLPALGRTSIEELYVATGHFRHGIMLAPITAQGMLDLITGTEVPPILASFCPQREALQCN